MRKYDKKIEKQFVNSPDIFFTVDSPSWRNPAMMDISTLCSVLNISDNVEEFLKDSSTNVFAYEFKDQDVDPTLPPGTSKLDKSLELAVDDNFLYVWIKSRWKRIPLSLFN